MVLKYLLQKYVYTLTTILEPLYHQYIGYIVVVELVEIKTKFFENFTAFVFPFYERNATSTLYRICFVSIYHSCQYHYIKYVDTKFLYL